MRPSRDPAGCRLGLKGVALDDSYLHNPATRYKVEAFTWIYGVLAGCPRFRNLRVAARMLICSSFSGPAACSSVESLGLAGSLAPCSDFEDEGIAGAAARGRERLRSSPKGLASATRLPRDRERKALLCWLLRLGAASRKTSGGTELGPS